MFLVLHECFFIPLFPKTYPTYQQPICFNVGRSLRWEQMRVMIPIFTFETLEHVSFFFIYQFLVMGQSAMTIKIVESLIVQICSIFVILFVKQIAALGQLAVAAITSKVKLGVQLIHFMSFMTHQHTP